MNLLYIINQLTITNGELLTNSLKKDNEVFLKQGSIDGACGPYCLFMTLIILGKIDRDEATNLWHIKRSTRFGKLIKRLEEHSTLFNAGTDLNDLENLLLSFSKTIQTKVNTGKGKDLTKFVIEELKNNKPVIVGVNGSKLEHWLLAVGYEVNSKEEPTKILFIDPSEDVLNNYYNAMIAIDKTVKGRYPFVWVNFDPNNKNVQLDQAISLGNK